MTKYDQGADGDETTDWPISPRRDTTPPPHPAPGGPPDFHGQDTMAAGTVPRQQPAPWETQAPPNAAAGPPPSWSPQPPHSSGYPPASAGGPPPSWPQQSFPGGYPPADPTPPSSAPKTGARNDTRRWLVVGAALAVTLAVVVGITLAVTGGGDEEASTAASPSSSAARVPAGPATTPQTAPTASSTSPGEPAPAPAPPPPAGPPINIAPTALPGLLLTPEQINLRLGTAGMTAAGAVENKLLAGGVITPANCTSAWGPVHDGTYNGSGYTAVAAQAVNLEPTHKVLQAVVSFPDAPAAKAFYDRQVGEWNACKLATITAQYNGGKVNDATLGVPATNGDVLTVGVVPKNSDVAGMQCERAMTARGNVIVDVRACSPTVGSAGWNLARDIGDKISPTP